MNQGFKSLEYPHLKVNNRLIYEPLRLCARPALTSVNVLTLRVLAAWKMRVPIVVGSLPLDVIDLTTIGTVTGGVDASTIEV